ncbi:hypothetical protein D3C73_1236000 [compost metagenome]
MRGFTQSVDDKDRFPAASALERSMEERLIGHRYEDVTGMAKGLVKGYRNLDSLRIAVEHERRHAKLLQHLPVAYALYRTEGQMLRRYGSFCQVVTGDSTCCDMIALDALFFQMPRLNREGGDFGAIHYLILQRGAAN